MMYANNFAAALLVDGKVLREQGDTVYLPFGSEYKIRLKNLNTLRALVHIEIDGALVTGSGGLVVNSYSTFDLERFIRDGNLNTGNRFKFIERTEKIETHRGIKVDDGIVSIKYQFERPSFSHLAAINTVTLDSFVAKCSSECKGMPTPQLNSSMVQASAKLNDAGITVEGGLSKQSFGTTSWAGSTGASYVLNIRLLGETADNTPVEQPITVKTKAKCKTCGTLNKATAKFCAECGTSLQIV